MNWFEAILNPTINERMSVCQYTSYVDLYDAVINVERAIKKRSNYFNEQWGVMRTGDNGETSNHRSNTSSLLGISTQTTTLRKASTPMCSLK